jgi:hypothetical protein
MQQLEASKIAQKFNIPVTQFKASYSGFHSSWTSGSFQFMAGIQFLKNYLKGMKNK